MINIGRHLKQNKIKIQNSCRIVVIRKKKYVCVIATFHPPSKGNWPAQLM